MFGWEVQPQRPSTGPRLYLTTIRYLGRAMNQLRLLVTLTAQADAAYDHAYHYKLRGRLWRALNDTEYEREHDTNDPLGFCYSNPMPWGDLEEGDERTVVISATREPLLATIAADLQKHPEFNIGDMPFRVSELRQATADVGEPGTRGTIETDTGVMASFDEPEWEEYGVTPDGNDTHFWREEDGLSAFQQRIRDNLTTKLERLSEEEHLRPEALDGPLFDEYELMKTFAIPLTVTTSKTRTVVLSKWRLGYTVRSDLHRELLNFALATGLGEKNGYGLGFVSILENTPTLPDTESAPTTL